MSHYGGEFRWARIDYRGLLTNEQMLRAMKHQAALLLRRLGLDKPHIGSGETLQIASSVGGIVLLPLDVTLAGGIRRTLCPNACNCRDQ